MKQFTYLLFLCLLAASTLLADAMSLKSIRRVYLENMDPKFEEYLRLEITRQFHGEMEVVLDRRLADGILCGRTERQDSAASRTGRRLGLDDVNTGFVEMLDRDGKVVLWSEKAGDRNIPFAEVGAQKVAARLVKKLRKAMR